MLLTFLKQRCTASVGFSELGQRSHIFPTPAKQEKHFPVTPISTRFLFEVVVARELLGWWFSVTRMVAPSLL